MQTEQVITFIIGTIVVLFGAYFVTYYVGMKASGQTRAGFRNKNIRLLDRYAISRDKQFCVIEIAGKVYIIGATNQTMTLLDTFDAAVFAKMAEESRDGDVVPWNETPVGRYGNKLTKMVVAFFANITGRAPPVDVGKKSDDSVDDEAGARFEKSLEEARRAKEAESDEHEDSPED